MERVLVNVMLNWKVEFFLVIETYGENVKRDDECVYCGTMFCVDVGIDFDIVSFFVQNGMYIRSKSYTVGVREGEWRIYKIVMGGQEERVVENGFILLFLLFNHKIYCFVAQLLNTCERIDSIRV